MEFYFQIIIILLYYLYLASSRNYPFHSLWSRVRGIDKFYSSFYIGLCRKHHVRMKLLSRISHSDLVCCYTTFCIRNYSGISSYLRNSNFRIGRNHSSICIFPLISSCSITYCDIIFFRITSTQSNIPS